MMEYWNVEKTSESNNNWVTFFFPTTWPEAAIRRSLRQLVGIGFLDSFWVGIGIGIGIDDFYPVFGRFFPDRVAPLLMPKRHARLHSIPIPTSLH